MMVLIAAETASIGFPRLMVLDGSKYLTKVYAQKVNIVCILSPIYIIYHLLLFRIVAKKVCSIFSGRFFPRLKTTGRANANKRSINDRDHHFFINLYDREE